MPTRIFDRNTVVLLACAAVMIGWRFVTVGSVSVVDAEGPRPLPGWGEIALTGLWVGSERAPVKIVEFGDFACEYCREQHMALARLRHELPDHVTLIFKHLPGRRGYALSKLAECAADHESFPRFLDAVFAIPQDSLLRSTVRSVASVTLEEGLVDACIGEVDMHDPEIERDISDALRFGVDGTPTLLLNGILLDGVTDYERLRAEVISELETFDNFRQYRTRRDRHYGILEN